MSCFKWREISDKKVVSTIKEPPHTVLQTQKLAYKATKKFLFKCIAINPLPLSLVKKENFS